MKSFCVSLISLNMCPAISKLPTLGSIAKVAIARSFEYIYYIKTHGKKYPQYLLVSTRSIFLIMNFSRHNTGSWVGCKSAIIPLITVL